MATLEVVPVEQYLIERLEGSISWQLKLGAVLKRVGVGDVILISPFESRLVVIVINVMRVALVLTVDGVEETWTDRPFVMKQHKLRSRTKQMQRQEAYEVENLGNLKRILCTIINCYYFIINSYLII